MRRTLAALCAVVVLMLALGASTAGAFTNGALPESALSPIATGVKCPKPEGQLANEAAAAFNSMALAAGKPLTISGCDSAYRPFDRQVYWRSVWCGQGLCGNAAIPGTSNHGLGLAVDVVQWVRGYIDLHGKRFGWCKCWSDAPQEWWHITWHPVFHRPNPGTNLHSPILRRGSGGPGQNIFVRKVQKLLRGHGDKTVTVDGGFGRSTAIAVRLFQKAQRIPVTGVVSSRTWKRLRRPISKPVKTTPKEVPPSGGTPAPPAHPHQPKPKPPKKHHHPRPHGKAWGPDISSNNGSVNFQALHDAGASFVITKATEGVGYINPYFGREQIRAIGAAHLVPGVYDYLKPEPGHSGAAEAAFFVEAIGHAGYGKGFLPPAADIEESFLSDQGTCHYLGEWVHVVKRSLGVKPIIYSSYSFPGEHMAGCDWLRNYDLWNAHPGSSPLVPAPWSAWRIWQYSWTGDVAGAGGAPMDLNKLFHGRSALVDLRVKELPKRARLAPRAKLSLPLIAPSLPVLRAAAPPAADQLPLADVPAPEGQLEAVTAPPTGEVTAGPPSIEQALAELIHALAVAIGG